MRHELGHDKQTKWLYANSRGTTVFAIYGIGDGTEATVLYAVGGRSAEKLSEWRDKYESGIDRSKRNAYRQHIEHIGVEQNQYGNSTNRDGENNISGKDRSFDGAGQISSTSQRRNNRGTVLEDSEQGKVKSKYTPTEETKNSGKASRELDTTYLDAVNRGDMKTAQRMVDERDTIKDKLPFITFGGKYEYLGYTLQ